MGMVSPGRLSFSQSGVLMVSLDCEKDSLQGLTVPMQKLLNIFGNEWKFFYESPFITGVLEIAEGFKSFFAGIGTELAV